MKNKKNAIYASLIILSGVLVAQTTLAQWNMGELYFTGLPEASIYDIITNFLYWLLGILGIAGIIGFALAGIMYLLSAGNDDMTGSAKKAMTASILGVIIGLSGLVVIRAIDWALNGFSFF